MKSGKIVVLWLVALCICAQLAEAQWQNARLLNETYETACKTARIAPSATGGFHAIYANTVPWQIEYRRYENGTLYPKVYVRSGFVPNPNLCAAGNGDIHLVWEDWDGVLEVGWAVSKNNGQSFTWSEITNTNDTKYPHIVPYGGDNSSTVLMSYWQAGNREYYFRLYNGTSWDTLYQMGSWGDSEYQVHGMCRSLKDGTVYRSYGTKIGGVYSLCYRRFNGSYWEPEVVAANQIGFFARQDIAVNPLGQVMVIWEQNDVVRTKLYTPGVGWGPENVLENKSGYASITSIPRSNDFYITYTYDVKRVYGRRWSGSSWSGAELVSVGMGDQFCLATDVCATTNGTIYACWEAWGSGDCQQHFAVRPGSIGSVGTVAGTVRDQYGQGIAGVSVGVAPYIAVSGSGGAYTLNYIPVGTYTLSATRQHYNGQNVSNIQVVSGQTTTVNFTVTAQAPASVSAFSVNPSNSVNRLNWTNPTSGNFHKTMIRYSTSGYPASPTDGALLCDQWTPPGNSDSYTHSNLTNGVVYYYSAFAHDDNGHYATPVQRIGTPSIFTCSEIKGLADGIAVDLKGKVVTAVFAGDLVLYVEDQDRSSAIRVSYSSPSGFVAGDVVDVSGTMGTRMISGVAAERVINATSVAKTPGSVRSPLAPLGLACHAVGGSNISALAPGVSGGVGLNNIGMLLKITGKVTAKLSSYIWVDDGSRIADPSGKTGVMVKCPDTSIPVVAGNIVSVTGIAEGNVPSGWTQNRRYIRIRDYGDIKLFQ